MPNMAPTPKRSAPASLLPLTRLPLVGRERETADIAGLLADPACRLVTLVGPGGIGKTRLATSTAWSQQRLFEDGTHFVALESIESMDYLASAVAEAIGLTLSGREPAENQLTRFVADRTSLLVLDNFEQLITLGAARLLTEWLAAAPQVKLLVTSREVLNLTQEWVYEVSGLAYPGEPVAPAEALSYGAVQFFTACARRVRRDFDFAAECPSIVRLCQLVEGMPLALELSAGWVKALSCAEIVGEFEHGQSALVARYRDLPARHRSVQAAFDRSWGLLSSAERDLLSQLSVFRGGFSRRAAQQVAGATLDQLSSLIDKSLLQRAPGGRYQMHELLRQSAQAKLAQSGEADREAHDRHGGYFARDLEARLADLHGPRQLEALTEIAGDLGNIRSAWRWAVERGDVDAIGQLADTAYYLWQMQSRYQEGLDALGAAISVLESPTAAPVLARVLNYQGWLRLRLGQLDAAREALEASRRLFEGAGDVFPSTFGGDPRTALGVLALVSGDPAEARRLGTEALLASEAARDRWNRMFALYVLENAAAAEGDYTAAQRLAEQAHAIAAQAEEQWFRAYLLNDLGRIALALGDVASALDHFRASYGIRETFRDPEGMGTALNQLAGIALQLGEHAQAHDYYSHALVLYTDLGDRGGLAATRHGLGRTCLAMGRLEEARDHLAVAERLAADVQYTPLVLAIVVSTAEWLLAAGPSSQAVQWLEFARIHAASEHDVRQRAERLLATAAAGQPAVSLAQAAQWGQVASLDRILTSVRSRLNASANPLDEPGEPAGIAPAMQWNEPLAPRELEVLRLIALGRSNKAIAAALGLRLGTVKWYTSQIYAKLGATSRTQAMNQARQRGLLG